MKTRIISGLVVLTIGVGVLVGIFTPVSAIFLAVLSAISAGEIMTVAGVKSNLVRVPATIFAAVIPAYAGVKESLSFDIPEDAVLSLYVIVMLIFMLITYEKTRFEQLAITLYGSIFVPYAYSGVLIIRDFYITYKGVYTKAETVYLIVFALFCAFLTDTFAYFVGRKFGKHKMAPVVSPKKSVEGAVGGLVLSVAFNVVAFAVAKEWIFDGKTSISYVFVIVMSVLLSVISMMGDLSASLLKRNFGVKDFGKIMPGHGGVMDRFDSFLFVIPALAAAIKFVNM